jgi:hypothetical protein
MENFVVDLPVTEIVHVLRRLEISMESSRLCQDVPDVRCQWIYTAVSGKQEYFTPIHSEHEMPPPMPGELDVGDFFCGAGGFSAGFRRAGFNIKLGVDKDERAAASWKVNVPSFLHAPSY